MGIGSIQNVPRVLDPNRLTQNQAKILMAVRSGYHYGYAISAYSRSRGWFLVYDTIYKGLKSMTERGLLTAEPPNSIFGQNRVLYSLTEAGKLALEKWEEGMKGVMSGNEK